MKKRKKNPVTEKLIDEACFRMRLSLAQMIIIGLHRKKWSVNRLAKRAGYSPKFVERVIQCKASMRVGAVANLVGALGYTAHIVTEKIDTKALN